MITLPCYDRSFAVEGGEVLLPLLKEHGFQASNARPEAEPLLAFRLEKKGRYFDLYLGEFLFAREQSETVVMELIASRIHQAICQDCEEVSFIKGDVVRHDDSVSVLAGNDFTGQTRLAEAFKAAGSTIWSRHYAVVNQAGGFLRYPAAHFPGTGLKAERILLLDYSSKPPTELSSVTPGEASLKLLPLVRGGKESTQQAMPRVAAACQVAAFRCSGHRGEAKVLVDKLLSDSLSSA